MRHEHDIIIKKNCMLLVTKVTIFFRNQPYREKFGNLSHVRFLYTINLLTASK